MSDLLQLITNATAVACIGTRDDLNNDKILACALVGFYLAKLGKRINTGNADGADQCFAVGANKVDPTTVHLYLPFRDYNPKAIVPGNHVYLEHDPTCATLARQYHGGYDTKLSDKGRLLMNRNTGIVTNSQLVIALPSTLKSWGGGTGHGMRIAKGLNIPVINIAQDEVRQELVSLIASSGLLPQHDTKTSQ